MDQPTEEPEVVPKKRVLFKRLGPQPVTPEQREEAERLRKLAAKYGTDPTAIVGRLQLSSGYNDLPQGAQAVDTVARVVPPFRKDFLLRVDAPFLKWSEPGRPGTTSTQGFSDIAVTAGWRAYNTPEYALLVGVVSTMPTAAETNMGSGKYTIGPTIATARFLPQWESFLMGLFTQQVSIGGDPAPSRLNRSKLIGQVNSFWAGNAALAALAVDVRRQPALQTILRRIAEGLASTHASGWSTSKGEIEQVDGGREFVRCFESVIREFMDVAYDTERLAAHPGWLLDTVLELASVPTPTHPAQPGDCAGFATAAPAPSARELESRLPDAVGPARHDQAREILALGRLSWRLRDDDNLLVGRLESQLLRALELAATRVRNAGRLRVDGKTGTAGEIFFFPGINHLDRSAGLSTQNSGGRIDGVKNHFAAKGPAGVGLDDSNPANGHFEDTGQHDLKAGSVHGSRIDGYSTVSVPLGQTAVGLGIGLVDPLGVETILAHEIGFSPCPVHIALVNPYADPYIVG